MEKEEEEDGGGGGGEEEEEEEEEKKKKKKKEKKEKKKTSAENPLLLNVHCLKSGVRRVRMIILHGSPTARNSALVVLVGRFLFGLK